MQILVTGGAGFIGSHLADALVEQAHEVTVVDNLRTGLPENVHPRATFRKADMADGDILAAIEQGEFQAVFHLAAQVNVRHSVEDPLFDAQQNVLSSLRLLEAASRGGVQAVIFASSGGTVYGEPTRLPVPESAPLAPISPYGCSKAALELYLHYYQTNHGLRTVALRFGNVYGPRQNPHGEAGVIAIFCERFRRGLPAIIFGDGEQTRDYIHVSDVVRANLASLHSSVSGCYNIGTGQQTSVNEIYHHVSTAFGTTYPATYAEPRPGELRHIALDTALAAQHLGWRAEIDLEEGLRQTVAWYLAQAPTSASHG